MVASRQCRLSNICSIVTAMGADQLFELRRTTFDTPHFRGIEFIETEAKSILNPVPGNYLPFNWTINPYRGCSHACSYCVEGGTPILLANGRTKPLADLRVGDAIYGTKRVGSYRRYVTTEVLAHWSTIKRAYRITLEDGTVLVASADHRFLSDRGWKHVTGEECGPLQRPFLTTNNKLIGVGQFAEGPKDDESYRRGYLCGMIRGDGHLGSYVYSRSGRTRGDVHRFRLALKDQEAIDRTRAYLALAGLPTKEFVFSQATENRKKVVAIRTSARDGVQLVRNLIAWPDNPSNEWWKGFLGGFFDAEGGHSGGIFRMSNTDVELIIRLTYGLRKFKFSYRIETQPGCNKPVAVVRLLGGLKEKLRFFHTFDPVITRKRTIEGVAVKSDARLRVVSVEDLGFEMPMYDITTGTGDFIANGVISHNCFARSTHTYMDMNAGSDFETKIVVKINAAQVLRRELRARKWKGEPIAMGTATDPYQRAEGRYKLMRGILEELIEVRNPFSILTKGTLILRDFDLLLEAAEVTDVSTAFSIATLDEDAWRKSEPGTPHPRKRMEAVKRLNEAGIPCGVMIAAILPGITDGADQLKEVVHAAVDAGATHVTPILLHLRPKVKEVYMDWLASTYPHLVDKYEAMYGRGAYASKGMRSQLGRKVADILNATPNPPQRRKGRRNLRVASPRREEPNEQLSLI